MSTLKTMKTFIKPMKMFEICSDHTQIFSTHMETYVEFYVSEQEHINSFLHKECDLYRFECNICNFTSDSRGL